MKFTLSPFKVTFALSAMVAALTLANAAVLWAKFGMGHDTLFGLIPFFDVNREGNLPAFYSACALLFAAVLFLVIAGHARQSHDRWRAYWAGLGWVFVFMAVDEAAEIHGLLSLPLRQLLHVSGVLLFAWLIPYAVLMLVFAVAYWRFFWALPRGLRAGLASAGVIYVVGAMGLEGVEGMIVSAHGGLDGGGLDHWQLAVTYSVEEFLEMAGIVLAIHALLRHIEQLGIELSLRVGSRQP